MLDILIYGAVISAVYALLAVGFTLIFGVARILNLAHGAFYALGAYCVYTLTANLHVPLVVAAVIAVLLVALFGIVMERVLVRPLRKLPPLAVLMNKAVHPHSAVSCDALIRAANAACTRSRNVTTASPIVETIIVRPVRLTIWPVIIEPKPMPAVSGSKSSPVSVADVPCTTRR